MPTPEVEYVNPRWNRRLALFSAGISLVLPVVGLAMAGDEWSWIDAAVIAAGLGLAAFVYRRYSRASVTVLEDSLRVQNAWRTTTVTKESVERVTGRALYGVACPLLHVRRGKRVRKVVVTAMPFPDVGALGLSAPVYFDL